MLQTHFVSWTEVMFFGSLDSTASEASIPKSAGAFGKKDISAKSLATLTQLPPIWGGGTQESSLAHPEAMVFINSQLYFKLRKRMWKVFE